MESRIRNIKYVIIIFFSIFISGHPTECSANKIDSIIILKADWNLLTDVPISATMFRYISNAKYTIRDQNTIMRYCQEFKSLEIIEDKRPNVRCKIYLFSNDSIVSTFCCSKNGILHNGMSYSLPEDLFSLINETTNNDSDESYEENDFPVYNDFLTSSVDEIEQKMKCFLISQLDCIQIKEFKLIISCKADIWGNIIDAKIYDFPDYLRMHEASLKEWMAKSVKWNHNPERSRADPLIFTLKFMNTQ